jgi:uncharacterized SAM-binding protein YcdF (DUF218 family)
MLFALSKLLFAFIAPGTLLTLMVLVGCALMGSPRRARLGRGLCLAAGLVLLAIGLLPVGEWALTPLENHTQFDPPAKVDGIVVIGGDEQDSITEARGMPTALDSMRRYVEFMDLAHHYPDAKLVFSGGPPETRSNARVIDSDVARDILTDLGVPQERMTYEKTSRNTWENAVYTADILHPDSGQNWLLVTSAWHMPRALGCFRKAGWTIYPAPTGYFTTGHYRMRFLFRFSEQLHMLTLAEHEYLGLVSYWLLGRTNELWPR